MTWHHWALCADSDLEPAAWTDRADDMQWGRSDANRAALDTCNRCPVKADCLATAMRFEPANGITYRSGIWGGTTPAQRTALAALLEANR